MLSALLLLHPEASLHVREPDLMVIGSARFADMARALAGPQTALRREVNPTVMTAEFAERLAQNDAFARSGTQGARLWAIGGEDDFAELAAHRPG